MMSTVAAGVVTAAAGVTAEMFFAAKAFGLMSAAVEGFRAVAASKEMEAARARSLGIRSHERLR